MTGLPEPTATPPPGAYPFALIINEVCPRETNVDLFPDGQLGNDNAVELFNTGTEPFNMAGYRLCTNLTCINLAGEIAPRKYKVFYEALGEVDLQYANERVYLQSLTPPYATINSVQIAFAYPNQCFARLYDGSTTWTNTYLPTMGFGNSAWSHTPTPTVTPV